MSMPMKARVRVRCELHACRAIAKSGALKPASSAHMDTDVDVSVSQVTRRTRCTCVRDAVRTNGRCSHHVHTDTHGHVYIRTHTNTHI